MDWSFISVYLWLTVFISFVNSKLLRVNEWHRLDLGVGEKAHVDLSLFNTCDYVSVIFSTETSDMTKLALKFDEESLKKVIVEPIPAVILPRPARLVGGCRDVKRKEFRINITRHAFSYDLRLGQQLIPRPLSRNQSDIFILIPQSLPCCLIRALLFTEKESQQLSTEYSLNNHITSNKLQIYYATKMPFSSTSTSIPPKKASRIFSIFGSKHSEIAVNVNHSIIATPSSLPTIRTTVPQKNAASWTDQVNKQWSLTFIICAIVIFSLMCGLVLFGFGMFVCLLKKPKGGKSPYAIDN